MKFHLQGVFTNGVRLTTSQVKCKFNQVYSLAEIWSDVGMLNLLTGCSGLWSNYYIKRVLDVKAVFQKHQTPFKRTESGG